MEDIHPDALSLEDASLESPPIQQDLEPEAQPVVEAEPEADPADVIEHNGVKYWKQGAAATIIAVERKRAREVTEKSLREKEIEPLMQKAAEADHLRQALAEAQPYVEHLRRHPELLQAPKPTPLEEQISDEEAAAEARDLELYNQQTGQPDVARAKRIIARRRTETQAAAQQAAQAAIGPLTSQSAQQVSRQNFVSMATRRDAQNQPLVDAKVLAEFWAQLPPELTQHPEVGELILDAAIGKSYRTKGRVQAPERPPVVSEPAGGRSGPRYEMDRMAKNLAQHAGMSDKAFTERAKTYVPGEVNILGD